MRSIIFFALLLPLGSLAQNETDSVEQYCMVVAQGRLLSNKVTIDVDYGNIRSYWSDQRVRDEEGKVKKFNTVIDALNYLGRQGWKLQSTLLLGTGPYVYHYVFKKSFSPSELGNN